MPTYEYECPRCGHRFEKFQSISDTPQKTCPKCKGRKLKRLIGTGGGIIFKGSGFYQTDYRSESYRKAAQKEGDGAPAPPKGDAKPGKKTEKKPGKEPGSGSGKTGDG